MGNTHSTQNPSNQGQSDQDPSKQSPALEVKDLGYRFKQHQALSSVSFTVQPREIHGFVGPNGAGKTTTLKVIATLLPPQTGRVRVFGNDVQRAVRQVRKRIGFMPDHFAMYRQMKVFEYLDFFAAAYGQPVGIRNKTIADVLELTDMKGRQHDVIKGLSRGMQQRVSLARVLVHDPDLLLLDEPASGLDPRARIELMEILRELSRMGKTVFISSHILSELATLCDSVTIIDRGRIKYTGSMAQLLTREGGTDDYVLTLAEPVVDLVERLKALPGVSALADPEDACVCEVKLDRALCDTGAVLRTTLDAGGKVVGFAQARRHLDEAFMDLTDPGVRS
jgi:ABC-2 type transport system ATP-binding protein